MKIIKRVDIQKIKWKKEYTCRRCTSEIEVELSDLHTIAATQDGPYYSPEHKYFICPVCKSDIVVPTIHIPLNAI